MKDAVALLKRAGITMVLALASAFLSEMISDKNQAMGTYGVLCFFLGLYFADFSLKEMK